MLIPLRPRIRLTRFPWLTLLVSVICIAVFIAQERNREAIEYNAQDFCTPAIAQTIEDGQKNYIKSEWKCPAVLSHIYLWGHTREHLQWHLDTIRSKGGDEQAEALGRIYSDYLTQAPHYITSWLWQPRGSWNPMAMVTSTLSHGSWDHLIGNLIFFISFSLIVETVLGAALYIMVFFGMAFGIATVDNLVHLGTESVPTLGLSGVVMGMIALVAYFAPRVKINFLWVFFFFGVPLYPAVISFPALGVAGWYVAWDVAAHLLFRDWSPVNYVAHLAGVLVALVLGITVFREKRHWAQDLLLDEPALKQVDDHWLTRFRQITAVPAVLYFATIAYLLLLGLFVWFMSLYSVQLLMVAPILIGSYYVYRSHKESNTPDSVRFKQAMDDMVSSRFGMGLPAMMKLAEGGYTRAQIELAKLYEQGRGVPKLDSKAAEWYRRAAESGNSHAQYCLALMMMQGRTVFHRKEEPIEWLEKSARQGVPEPAMSLAHYYARGRGGEREPEKACHWYHHAGKLYLQQGRLQDLDVVVKEIRSVDPDYEHLPALEAALKRES